MSAAIKMPPHRMTVAEFLAWNPGAGWLWQLRDGEPEMMSPPSDVHATIQNEVGRLLANHLAARGSTCRVAANPGVIPRQRSEWNMLVPDLGISCQPPGGRALPDPIVLVEILSPSNEAETRANVWAYLTIPTLAEIVLIGSVRMGAEVLRRGADGVWSEQAEMVGPDGELRLDSIGYAAPLRDAYRTSGLA